MLKKTALFLHDGIPKCAHTTTTTTTSTITDGPRDMQVHQIEINWTQVSAPNRLAMYQIAAKVATNTSASSTTVLLVGTLWVMLTPKIQFSTFLQFTTAVLPKTVKYHKC